MDGPTYMVRDRLARTPDGRLVPYEHPEAAFLAYSPGQVIPLAEAQEAGLLEDQPAKRAERVEDKELEMVEDKGVRIPPESTRSKRVVRHQKGTR